MIALSIRAASDADQAFVTRLSGERTDRASDSFCLSTSDERSLWCGMFGLFELAASSSSLSGDIVLVDPVAGRAERLIRPAPAHNSLLVTEQCDQLCVMCSQPPRKTHFDRFAHFEAACLLADPGSVIGITGGEPMLHADALFAMLERLFAQRGDLCFHILSNGQHFTAERCGRLVRPLRSNVVWGIPLYASTPVLHDRIVGKAGAFHRLQESFAHLLAAGARIELRTVLLQDNLAQLERLARYVSANLPFVEQWSLMGLENMGFAVRRWDLLHVDVRASFAPVAAALDHACLHGIPARLFNIPLCHVPQAYRGLAVASISDWKQRFAPACSTCRARPHCAGFFEWHPDQLVEEVIPL